MNVHVSAIRYTVVPLWSFCITIVLHVLMPSQGLSQAIRFNRVFSNRNEGNRYAGIAQDKDGYMWFSTSRQGFQRYDGVGFTSYTHDPSNTNSLASNYVECILIDSADNFWLGTHGAGLDYWDRKSNTFTHFRHSKEDPGTLSNDTILALLLDRSGTLWIGTYGGLNVLDSRTGKFRHFKYNKDDPESLSANEVRTIYEDHAGTIWVGCGTFYSNPGFPDHDQGGLNRLDQKTGKFKRYLHDPDDPTSIADGRVRAIFEDSKGNFWVGSRGDGLHTLNRETGVFTHYYYDAKHPEKLSRPPQFYMRGAEMDNIMFITEDKSGRILIGTLYQGINVYDPSTSQVTHYGPLNDAEGRTFIKADTLTGFTGEELWLPFVSRDGIMWITTLGGEIFNIVPTPKVIPYFRVDKSNPAANSLYCEKNNKVLWIGSTEGLYRIDTETNDRKIWKHDPKDANSLCNDTISSLKADAFGNLWLGTNNGLSKFEISSGKFTNWKLNSNSIHGNLMFYLYIYHDVLWIGTFESGLYKLDIATDKLSHVAEFDGRNIVSITGDDQNNLWIASDNRLIKLNSTTSQNEKLFTDMGILSVHFDRSGTLWASSASSLMRFDKQTGKFVAHRPWNANEPLKEIINIIEDHDQNLWLTSRNSITRLNAARDEIRIFNSRNGVHANNFFFADNFVGNDGRLYFGDDSGYYSVLPADLTDKSLPVINITDFSIGSVQGSNQPTLLTERFSDDRTIELAHDRNNFIVDFIMLAYDIPGLYNYQVKLENFDPEWRKMGDNPRSNFYGMSPGEYVLRMRGIANDGRWGEKLVKIIITPPWWRRWWAYAIYGLSFVGISIVANRLIRMRVLEKERAISREKELAQAKEIEKAYHDLRITQAQLVQSEKMASLGELTAGIAHEIQNPLNFVNNFSEVSNELMAEMKIELTKGDIVEASNIADGITQNLEKIRYHGKRAEAIVKGMLQHSRQTQGVRELTDINALCDEYLRLSYHGFRAKDKTFNAELKTDFDKSLDAGENGTGKVNIIPQDFGRALLNIINNAFYATNEKQKTDGGAFRGCVSIQTKKSINGVAVIIKDNGNGIPSKIINKVFQPFFTTKPTGQGTGLGLSLSYDIITKGHNGTLSVESSEGNGSTFVLTIPA